VLTERYDIRVQTIEVCRTSYVQEGRDQKNYREREMIILSPKIPLKGKESRRDYIGLGRQHEW